MYIKEKCFFPICPFYQALRRPWPTICHASTTTFRDMFFFESAYAYCILDVLNL